MLLENTITLVLTNFFKIILEDNYKEKLEFTVIPYLNNKETTTGDKSTAMVLNTEENQDIDNKKSLIIFNYTRVQNSYGKYEDSMLNLSLNYGGDMFIRKLQEIGSLQRYLTLKKVYEYNRGLNGFTVVLREIGNLLVTTKGNNGLSASQRIAGRLMKDTTQHEYIVVDAIKIKD